jgi:hypothetical protein
MCTYVGQWPQSGPVDESTIVVTADGQPLPPLAKELAGAGEHFGWGSFSRWADTRLLAYTMLFHEMCDLIKLPEPRAHKVASTLADFFVTDIASRFDKQWTLTSEDIRNWIERKHSEVWSSSGTMMIGFK